MLPPDYNPHLHKKMLAAAGADTAIVDEIFEGFRMSGAGKPTGFFDPLPSADFDELKRFEDKLQKALERGP